MSQAQVGVSSGPNIQPTPSNLIGISGGRASRRLSPIKRTLDLIVSVSGLIITGPILLCIALAVRISIGKPVFFRQLRTGLGGEPFEILKFRTMTDGTDEHGNLLPDEERQVPLGRFLRKTSLDELPALINVARGEMSLVGPRPLIADYFELYSTDQLRRFEVRGGITGLAQVNGRNLLTWEEKFELDVEYVDRQSIWLDLQILAKTFSRVLRQSGISEEGSVTATRFLGSVESEASVSDSGQHRRYG